MLGFPFIFRGALDVRATSISEGMKMAAARALADLAKESVPESVRKAYGGADFSFGPGYIVPKPFDPRVIEWEALAVAKAACEEGLADQPITDWDAYRKELRDRWRNSGSRRIMSFGQLVLLLIGAFVLYMAVEELGKPSPFQGGESLQQG